MKTIYRTDKNKAKFTRIDNKAIEDTRLSFKARGILCYLLSKPDEWKLRVADMMNRSSDGKAAIKSGIDELIHYGYIVKKEQKAPGRFLENLYFIYETTVSDFPTRISGAGNQSLSNDL